jgi:hypothetical protein
MTESKQFFYSYCGNWQGWCIKNDKCTFDYKKPTCKYYKKYHPLNNEQPTMIPQETKNWLDSLVNRNGNSK